MAYKGIQKLEKSVGCVASCSKCYPLEQKGKLKHAEIGAELNSEILSLHKLNIYEWFVSFDVKKLQMFSEWREAFTLYTRTVPRTGYNGEQDLCFAGTGFAGK